MLPLNIRLKIEMNCDSLSVRICRGYLRRRIDSSPYQISTNGTRGMVETQVNCKPILLMGALFLSFISCGVEPGSFSMTFSWDTPPIDAVYIWIRVEERSDPNISGKILASIGPEAYLAGNPVEAHFVM